MLEVKVNVEKNRKIFQVFLNELSLTSLRELTKQ